MKSFKAIGFIGSGRVTEFLLTRLKQRTVLPQKVFVSDPDATRLEKIVTIDPETIRIVNSNGEAARADLICLAFHPPVITAVTEEIRDSLSPEAVVISLLPTITVQKLSNLLGGFSRIARMIPNAPSLIGMGYNPVVFSPALNNQEKAALLNLFENWGESPEVPEEHLEAYAILTGMGPTYFWFQWLELQRLGKEFGLTEADSRKALNAMISGAAETLFNSGLTPEETLDLIPAYPLKKQEDSIREILAERLGNIYQKLITDRM